MKRVILKLEAEINASKRLEFSQSLMSFINDLPSCPGFINFKEKQGTLFNIQLSWSNSTQLQEFQSSDVYRVFMGAIITLSTHHQTQVFDDKLEE